MSRTLPPDGVNADALEHADAGTRGNLSVEMFRPVGTTAGVRDWELVSGAGGGGWDVWEPSVVRRLVSEFAGASPVAVSNAMWPDRCLGLPQAPVEPCSPTPVPGFLVTIAIAGKTFEYRVGEDGGASIVRNVPSVEPTPRSPSATPDTRPSAPGG